MQHHRMFHDSGKVPRIRQLQGRPTQMSSNKDSLVVGGGTLKTSSTIGNTITIGKSSYNNPLYQRLPKNTKGQEDSEVESSTPTSSKPYSNRQMSLSSLTPSKPLASPQDKANPVSVTLWFHEARTSTEEVIMDANLIPGAQENDVFELKIDIPGYSKGRLILSNIKPPSTSSNVNNQTISLASNPLQKIMDLPSRTAAIISKVDPKTVEADTIEVFIKDISLHRDSMWNFAKSLVGTSAYTNKRLDYLGARCGTINNIYKDGHKMFSAYIGQDTVINFRSESSRLIFLVQLSREMWNFEETGEILFHKLVNTLLPRIFQQWRSNGTHHIITIVLFTSLDLTSVPWTRLGQGERPRNRRDYFRVAVDQVDISQWDAIMANLRLEFANFKRDIMLQHEKHNNELDNSDLDQLCKGTYRIRGETLPSVKGNILEAVNLALSIISDRFTLTDLKHTVSNFVLVSPGTGLFDVDYELLRETSRKMLNVDMALDIICLSQPPLHVVPLFRFRDYTGKVSHCVPNWCDISFYDESGSKFSQWVPRCKIYELQMMGVMENERKTLEIERFNIPQGKTAIEIMEDYDYDIFKPAESVNKQVKLESALKKRKNPNSTVFLEWSNSSKPMMRNASSKTVNASTTAMSAVGTTVSTTNDGGSALNTLYSLNKIVPLARMKPNSSGNVTPRESNTPVLTPTASSKTSIFSTNSDLYTSKNGNSSLKNIKTRLSELDSPNIPIPIAKLLNSKNKTTSMPDLGTSPLKRSNLAIEPSKSTSSFNEEQNYWTHISNPSKEAVTDVLEYLRKSKWNGVFPPKIKRKNVKWRSFKAPVALPTITKLFPSSEELELGYTFQLYDVILSPDNFLQLKTSMNLMRELIQFRILMGFQICYGESVKKAESERSSGGSPESVFKYFPDDIGSNETVIVYLGMDDEIHRIQHDFNGALSVQLYRRKPTAMKASPVKLGTQANSLKTYYPLIRTRYAEEYSLSKIDGLKTKLNKFNWNQFDQFLAGFDTMPDDQKKFFHMKFVIMPTDIPKNAFYINNESLSDEEIRVEGLRKLINIIEKGKFNDTNNSQKLKEDILPEISFYTGNLYEFLNEQLVTNESNESKIPKLSTKYDKSINLDVLAKDLQGPMGLKLVDRVWHFKTHACCFLGNELVSWLISVFEDIDSREEAVDYGQTLMERGLFQHVENRHGFLDGYYFYEFANEYSETKSKSWFGGKPEKNDKLQELSDSSSERSISDKKSTSRKKFMLSRKILYNTDPTGKSNRPEIITVHYDTVHNPDHCYHIRLEWMNVTGHFVDETVTSWARFCERYGLKLVETPWNELCTIPLYNPFHSFVEFSLELNPWEDSEFSNFEKLKTNKFFYHLHLLDVSGFLLDNRSSSFFSKNDIEVSYSWGKPVFRYAQYIHRTGTYIVELRDNGELFLAPNNIHLVRQRSNISATSEDKSSAASQAVMLEFRSRCKSEVELRKIFREAKEVKQG